MTISKEQGEVLADELERLGESAKAALRNLHGLPALATESDTQPGRSAIWMENGLAGCGQVAISTGEFPCVQTDAICALVNVGALFADKLPAILTALRSPGIDREAVLEEAASDEMVEALAEEFCLAGFSEGVQAVLREDDPSYWSKITPDAQESYRRGVRAILATIRAFKTTPNEPVVEDRGEAE